MKSRNAPSKSPMLAAAAAVLGLGLASPETAWACTATIGNFVWHDLNGNGLQDPGEPGIANVQIDLYDADGQTLIRSVLTDESGFYAFTGRDLPPVCEQTYIVRAATPAAFVPTLIGSGDPGVDSNDPAGALVTPTDNTGSGWDGIAADDTIDFGFVPPVVCEASIGNFVWNDLNNNGVQDAGEPGISGIVMSISGPGSYSATGTTSAGGGYSFGGLCAGTYTVCAGIPLGFQPTLVNAGDNDAMDSDGVAVQNNSCAAVTIGGSGADDTIDFGFWQLPDTSPGTGTPGYWKNHPEAWPVNTIEVGGIPYTKEQALEMMGLPDGDKTVTMFRSLVSARLNVLIGNNSSCIASTIAAADAWMATYGPVGSGVKARTGAWKSGEPLYQELDAYNNGDRCAPHRE